MGRFDSEGVVTEKIEFLYEKFEILLPYNKQSLEVMMINEAMMLPVQPRMSEFGQIVTMSTTNGKSLLPAGFPPPSRLLRASSLDKFVSKETSRRVNSDADNETTKNAQSTKIFNIFTCLLEVNWRILNFIKHLHTNYCEILKKKSIR